MINKQAFSAGMGVLANNFNRTVDAALSRVWYGVLSAKLTTEQFEEAVTRSLAEDSFWPTAASLVAKVAALPDAEGRLALEHVNRVLSVNGGHRFLSYETFHSEFDGPTKAAISAVGGLAEITGCSIERHATLAKRFAAVYAKAVTPVAMLPAPRIDPRVRQLTERTAAVLTLTGRDRAAGPDK